MTIRVIALFVVFVSLGCKTPSDPPARQERISPEAVEPALGHVAFAALSKADWAPSYCEHVRESGHPFILDCVAISCPRPDDTIASIEFVVPHSGLVVGERRERFEELKQLTLHEIGRTAAFTSFEFFDPPFARFVQTDGTSTPRITTSQRGITIVVPDDGRSIDRIAIDLRFGLTFANTVFGPEGQAPHWLATGLAQIFSRTTAEGEYILAPSLFLHCYDGGGWPRSDLPDLVSMNHQSESEGARQGFGLALVLYFTAVENKTVKQLLQDPPQVDLAVLKRAMKHFESLASDELLEQAHAKAGLREH